MKAISDCAAHSSPLPPLILLNPATYSSSSLPTYNCPDRTKSFPIIDHPVEAVAVVTEVEAVAEAEEEVATEVEAVVEAVEVVAAAVVAAVVAAGAPSRLSSNHTGHFRCLAPFTTTLSFTVMPSL